MLNRQLDEEAIFHIARRIQDTTLRADYLEQACGDNTAVLARVQALLEVHEKEQEFLRSNSAEPEPTIDSEPITEGPGTEIGRYRLMEQIGEGGMGVVFVAEQRQPLKRKVALKVIKPGMDSKAVVSRFEAERQALALMDHPNIAHVLDAGSTTAGRPYFVMEYVRGIPITEYCDKNKLTIRERLDLFIQVCQAIQHAHQKGIVHRDIKPSNVLVTLHDGKPVPKVIDFGVAKALNTRLTDRTIYTAHMQVIGTLMYMSPEQAEMSGLDIDTRSDVYSLGVLLYELLTGTTPFLKKDLDQAGFDEQRRMIRESDPPRASVRISSLGETATTVAEHRKTDARKLHQQVRGDLDWIVMKALEKDRTRRYETASGFAVDVQRFLANEPIEARPPSALYRFRKYTSRNRSLVVSALVIMMMAILGIVGLVLGYVNAVKAANVQAEAAAAARDNAAALKEMNDKLIQKERQLTGLIHQLQDELKNTVLVEVMRGDETRALEAIEKAEAAGVSESWIRIFHGQLALYSGKHAEAIRLLTEAVDLDPDSVAANAMLATAYEYSGFGDDYGSLLTKVRQMKPIDVCDRLFKAMNDEIYFPHESAKVLPRLVEEYPSWGLARVMLASATLELAWNTGRWEDAKRALDEIEIAKAVLPELPMLLAKELMANLCALELAPEDLSERRTWHLNADVAAKKLEDEYPNSAPRELAAYHDRAGRTDRAIKVLDAAVDAGAGPLCESFLAALLLREGRYEEMASNKYGWWGKYEIMDKEELAKYLERLRTEEVVLSVPFVWERTLLYSCGYRDEAEDTWRRLLAENSDTQWNLRDTMEFFVDDLDQQGILRRAKESKSEIRTGFAHFCIAVKALAFYGERDIAIHHFEQCLEHPALRIDVYFWAKAFLRRMNEDASWPGWARNP